jgi:glycerol-3-phosphate dehydrogenase (NAD(P)+)
VAVIGAGELGRAIGALLKAKNIEVEFWDADTSVVPGQRSLQEIIPAAEHIAFCVPSWAMRTAITAVAPHLKPGATVLSFAKGLEMDSLQTMAELVPALLPPAQPFVIVGGPMLAAEIVSGSAAVCVFASGDEAALSWTRRTFESANVRVETTTDVLSVSVGGVLKNVYAVLLGIADGLTLSGNEKGWVTGCAIKEMVDIATVLGADQRIILGSAGVGDLIATGYSVHSRNREMGIEIVTTGKCNLRGEGLNAVPLLMQRLGDKTQLFPLLMLVHQIGIVCAPARAAFEQYFKTAR